MNKGYLILGIIGVVIATLVGSFLIAWSEANSLEQQLHIARQESENVLAQYGQQVKEAAQIPGMQRDDLIKVFTEANKARYGAEGSKAGMQWIQEQNPNMTPETYTKIQQIIEAGREKFSAAQKRMLDIKRSLATLLGSPWKGTFAKLAGYPTIKVGYPIGTQDDYPIVSTAIAQGAFKNGREEGPIQLR